MAKSPKTPQSTKKTMKIVPPDPKLKGPEAKKLRKGGKDASDAGRLEAEFGVAKAQGAKRPAKNRER